MKGADRFQEVYSQGIVNMVRILVDRETGVNYLVVSSGESGGITPLIGPDGRPVVTPMGPDSN